jgi:hypothetical protein
LQPNLHSLGYAYLKYIEQFDAVVQSGEGGLDPWLAHGIIFDAAWHVDRTALRFGERLDNFTLTDPGRAKTLSQFYIDYKEFNAFGRRVDRVRSCLVRGTFSGFMPLTTSRTIGTTRRL